MDRWKDEKDSKYTWWQKSMLISTGIILVSVISVVIIFYEPEPKPELFADGGLITEIKITTNATDIWGNPDTSMIKDSYITFSPEFLSREQAMFANSDIQKQYENCVYSDGTFTYQTNVEEFKCLYDKREIKIER